jgi:hypothetical protein
MAGLGKESVGGGWWAVGGESVLADQHYASASGRVARNEFALHLVS